MDAAVATAARYQHFDQTHQQAVINEGFLAHRNTPSGAAASDSRPTTPDSESFVWGANAHAGAGAADACDRGLHMQRQVCQPVKTPKVHEDTAAADWGVQPGIAQPLPETPAVRPATPHGQQWVRAAPCRSCMACLMRASDGGSAKSNQIVLYRHSMGCCLHHSRVCPVPTPARGRHGGHQPLQQSQRRRKFIQSQGSAPAPLARLQELQQIPASGCAATQQPVRRQPHPVTREQVTQHILHIQYCLL